jgi:CBS domain-containing protein
MPGMVNPFAPLGSEWALPDGHRQITLDKISLCRSANVRVEDFMTRRVVTITPDTTLLAAARLMLEHRVGGLPVVDASGQMIGVFSESDLLREAGKGEDQSPWLHMMVGSDGEPAEPIRLDARKVGDTMTRELITIAPDASIAQACRLLHEHRLRRLPVVESGKLVGMIGRPDLVRAVAESAEKASPKPTHDVSVDARVAELERQIWRDRARLVRPF